ncbi:energy transducer TonB [Opitutus sp. ER46]|uniref:energy transducer TonB n=1 Tax=Opitutus sp. ER46 TaxID=2161864 RepID=UPI000D322E2D|nr:energy transducer TonB [Opitutus sp. ER46]PTX96476.1 energy transducer TonB [Opitutus sp. ER46]
MRRDLIIGFIVSALIHGGAFFGERLIPEKKVEQKKVEERPVIQVVEMPPIEPEEPEVVETSDEPVKPMDFAPPMQTDVPQVVTDTSFVQRIQPPPPENVKPATGIVAIPENRDMSQFRGMKVFDLASLDQQPVARVRTPPQYPFEMRRAGVTGEVTVDFIVDANGEVQNAYAVKSTQREFEAPAVQAVSKWKFKPGRKGGRNVNTHMQVPIVFTLNDE